jgi:pantoate--beta-alanine ligase
MDILHTIEQVRKAMQKARDHGRTIGLVPTMGALHEGHGLLMKTARQQCGCVVVSIFVNPTQFGPTEDFTRYPRTFETDAEYCRQLGIDIIFVPTAEEMYPRQQLSWVQTERLTDGLCGAFRPGHFRGVTTVCAKLFNIVQPDVAYFGQKDAQQVVVIRRMVQDLNMPLQICACPIVREKDGLAMSSRNKYLSADERKRALCLYHALTLCKKQIIAGQRQTSQLTSAMKQIIEQNQGRIDYISIVDPRTLEPLETVQEKAMAALAVYIGQIRLIDNFLIDLNDLENPV